MKPNPRSLDNTEIVPDNILVVDLIHRTVKRRFEGEGVAEPVAPTVRVINLSIGDPSRLLDQAVSPLARLIDYLSSKYNVLFIISCGNRTQDIVLSVTETEFLALSSDEREKQF
jgi:hypothetical protein